MPFYERFEQACKQKGVAPTVLCERVGLNRSAATSYKRGSIPSRMNMKRLAEALEVDVDWLQNGEVKGEEVDELRQLLKERPDLRSMLYASRNLKTDDVMYMTRIIKGLRNAD